MSLPTLFTAQVAVRAAGDSLQVCTNLLEHVGTLVRSDALRAGYGEAVEALRRSLAGLRALERCIEEDQFL